MLSLIAMEPPVSLEADSIRDEKVKVLRAVEHISNELMPTHVVRAQYKRGVVKGKRVPAYSEEDGVRSKSNTETFVALKLHIENWRWHGVPFYLRAGKRMPKTSTEMFIQFKDMPDILFGKLRKKIKPNTLAISVQPEERIAMEFNVKAPGRKLKINKEHMIFTHQKTYGIDSLEAYERLMYDVMTEERALFTRWDEVKHSWAIIEPLQKFWRSKKQKLCYYKSGTWGPKESDDMLAKNGRVWIKPH